VLVTARQNKLREATEKWLLYHKVKYDQLYMKADDSGLSDSEAKRIMLKEIREKYGEPFMVFDDRHEVNEMWVNEGVYLFDVSQKETR
jgi:translation initiation factor 2 alpha subunit (eIF-2alpha)